MSKQKAERVFFICIMTLFVLFMFSAFAMAADQKAQTADLFRLPTTVSSTKGVIQQNGSVVFNTLGTNNLFLGTGAANMSSGVSSGVGYNVGIGDQSMRQLNSGHSNVATGANSLTNLSNGTSNSAFGTSSLYGVNTGGWNSGFGYNACRAITSNVDNACLGAETLTYPNANQTGMTAVGAYAMQNSTGGSEGVAIGYQTARDTTTSSGFTAVGSYAGRITDSGGVYLTTGDYATLVGYKSALYGAQYTNATAIGANSRIGRSDAMALGAGSGYRVGIGIISNPTSTLDIPGDVNLLEIANPGISSVSNFKMYANSTTHKLMASINGGAYAQVFPQPSAVSEIAITVPSFLAVAGSPVTTSGTVAITLNTQNKNLIFSGPSSGSASAPTFRSLVASDLPTGIVSGAGTSGQVLGMNQAGTSTEYKSLVAGSGITITSAPNSITLAADPTSFPVQISGTLFAGPVSGASAIPTFRQGVETDLVGYQRITVISDAVNAGLSFTPTSNKTHTAFYHREGPYMVIDGQITETGTGAAGSVTVSIAGLPGSPTIATALIPGGTTTTNAGESQLGYAHVWTGAAWTVYHPVYASTQSFQFVSAGTRLAGNTYASGAVFNYTVKLPITGWNQ